MPNLTVKTPHLTGGGWSRAVLYIVTLAAAVWAGVAMSLGHESVGLAQAVVAVLAALTGGTATLNIAKAPDQHKPDLMEVLKSSGELLSEVKALRVRAEGADAHVAARSAIGGDLQPVPPFSESVAVSHLSPGLPAHDAPTTGLPHFDRD